MPGIRTKKGKPSCKDGVSWATTHIHRPWSKNVLSTESYRSLRDGFFGWHTPGNKLPGYDHSVPSGQRLSTPVHEFDATTLRAAGLEDDDENEAPCEHLFRRRRSPTRFTLAIGDLLLAICSASLGDLPNASCPAKCGLSSWSRTRRLRQRL